MSGNTKYNTKVQGQKEAIIMSKLLTIISFCEKLQMMVTNKEPVFQSRTSKGIGRKNKGLV
jgi:LysM repeat protein